MALLPLVRVGLRLYFRNTMALVYGYLFPTIFLIAFWVLYRYDRVPLIRHLGELLTVTILSGACFGLPTTMVSERERGVWRRYRLTPVPTGRLVAAAVSARYLILLTAGLLQSGLAIAAGMPLPRHPVELLIAFTIVSFAFLGLGLVIATLADTVPAVQALGQSIFLPMLIIGGVAVPLASLPGWAQHVSAFFPGRYAVETIQAAVTGSGLAATAFSVYALLVIGAAGCFAGAKMFRWDAEQRLRTHPGRGWVVIALAAWLAVGGTAEVLGRININVVADRPQIAAVSPVRESETAGRLALEAAVVRAPVAAPPRSESPKSSETAKSSNPPKKTVAPDLAPVATAANLEPASWRDVTLQHIETEISFARLPPDSGVVTPIAAADEEPEAEVSEEVERMRVALQSWEPGKVQDVVQRVRNFLYVAAVPDLFQMPMERFVPRVIYERLEANVPREQLIQALYWIALHPADGDDSAVDQLRPLGLANGPSDTEELRGRTAVYAVKLLGRLTGNIK